MTLSLLAVAALLQSGGLEFPGVHADSAVVIAQGDTVRVFTRQVNDGVLGRGGRRLDVIYATGIPAADAAARAAQADRAAQFFGPQAIEVGARRLSIGICDTQACAARKDPPAAWFLYERTTQGWKRRP